MGGIVSKIGYPVSSYSISNYIKIIDGYQFISFINNSKFLRTVKVFDERNKKLLLVKVFFKKDSDGKHLECEIKTIFEYIKKETELLSKMMNILPYYRLIEIDDAGYIVRKYLRTNLYDRLLMKPFLESIEKLFFIFQILKIIENIHSEKIHHGDLKLENFLVTSCNWIMLTDFSNYIKPKFLPEDNPNIFYFFFNASDRNTCYIAPERFHSSDKISYIKSNLDNVDFLYNKDGITNSMDLFSLGCIISEILTDGLTTFTLSQIFKYKKNEYKPDLLRIDDSNIKKIILNLLLIDPNERKSASQILNEYKSVCFPEFFYGSFYEFIYNFNNDDFFFKLTQEIEYIEDSKLNYIYNNFDTLTGTVSNKCECDIIKKYNDIDFELYNSKLYKNYCECKNTISEKLQYDNFNKRGIIILSLILSVVGSLKKTSTKIKACELIFFFSIKASEEIKMNRSLPYFCFFLDQYIECHLPNYDFKKKSNNTENSELSKLICIVLNFITATLLSCKKITPINFPIFTDYLIPKINKLLVLDLFCNDLVMIKMGIAKTLPFLALVSKRFLLFSKNFNKNCAIDFKKKNKSAPLFKNDHGLNEILFSFKNTDNLKKILINDFQILTLELLNDEEENVVISLINNILPLCKFFGINKTIKMILPVLTEFLEHFNQELKLSVLSSFFKIGVFLGYSNLYQKLLPLFIEKLSDPNDLVILKVFEIFKQYIDSKFLRLCSKKFINKFYKEMLENSIHLLLHPNVWIRHSVINLILLINENVNNLERVVFLYPILNKYTKYNLIEISWDNLFFCLEKSLSYEQFNISVNWSSSFSNLFLWERKLKSLGNFTDNINELTIKSSEKNLQKELDSENKDFKAFFSQDEKSYIRFFNFDFNKKDLWKVYILKNVIFKAGKMSNQLEDDLKKKEEKFLFIFNYNLPHKPIKFGVHFHIKNLDNFKLIESKKTQLFLLSPFENMDNLFNSNKNLKKVHPSLQIDNINVLAKLDFSNVYNRISNNYLRDKNNDFITIEKVFFYSKKFVTSTIKCKYHDFHTLNYIRNLNIQPIMIKFIEFSLSDENLLPMIESFENCSFNSIVNENQLKPWNSSKNIILKINSNNSDKRLSLDSINVIVMNSENSFFITGSDSGKLKLWNISSIDKILNLKKPTLCMNLNSSISSIEFKKNKNLISVCTTDGFIKIFRIDTNFNCDKKLNLSDFCLVRKYKLKTLNMRSEYAIFTNFIYYNDHKYLIIATSFNQLIFLDIILMKEINVLKIPSIYGFAISFLVLENKPFLYVGSSNGILSFWDLDKGILIESWKIFYNKKKTIDDLSFPILKIDFVSNDNFMLKNESKLSKTFDKKKKIILVIHNSLNPIITIWDLDTLFCLKVLNSNFDDHNNYKLYKFKNSITPQSVKNFFDNSHFMINDINHNFNEFKTHFLLKFFKDDHNYLIYVKQKNQLIIYNLDLDTESILTLNTTRTSLNNNKNTFTYLFNGYIKNYVNFLIDNHYDLKLSNVFDLEILTNRKIILFVDNQGNFHFYS